jgi:hypothetical protein
MSINRISINRISISRISISRRLLQLLPVTLGIWFGASWLIGSEAIAADRVVMKYKGFRRSVPITDLVNFAETGEVSRNIRPYLRASGQRPAQVRENLNKPIEIRARTLDRFLNSTPGEAILKEMSRYVYTKSRDADEQALRSSLTLSASGDDNIKLIEVLQNYPTEEIFFDGNRIVSAYGELQAIATQIDRLEDLIPQIRL